MVHHIAAANRPLKKAKRAASNQLTARDAEVQDVLTADQKGYMWLWT
jgi:hypothetical protein